MGAPLDTFRLIPPGEQLVGDYLREHPAVAALEARVAGTAPSSQTLPWVKLVQLDATDMSDVEHLIDYMLQVDCYAGEEATRSHAGQAEAWLLARTVRAALKSLHGRVLDGAAVSGVTFTGMARIPDTSFEPARERVIVTASVYMHAG